MLFFLSFLQCGQLKDGHTCEFVPNKKAKVPEEEKPATKDRAVQVERDPVGIMTCV